MQEWQNVSTESKIKKEAGHGAGEEVGPQKSWRAVLVKAVEPVEQFNQRGATEDKCSGMATLEAHGGKIRWGKNTTSEAVTILWE